ncbi:MAG: adenylate/guanylate cyclase domain-containing protein [Brevundimonas sp.]|uniref:adenylate/guanylate cyclase domain-containing protein n=1 Tax=Brevundimonas TaxID=41275 RepID=UPI0022AC64AE|nr:MULTISPECIES: adenylate/guanylate cyclase domain-containing protein [Brevundimonas]
MAFKENLTNYVVNGLAGEWEITAGTVVPHEGILKVAKHGSRVQATILYADLADSTQLVDGSADWFAADVYKAFLLCAGQVIRSDAGEIVSYDGDRIMAVYMGDDRDSRAVRSALTINWAVREIVRPAIQRRYPTSTYQLRHVVGVDRSQVLATIGGIRGNNDLIWIGRAANYAAKLCSEDDNWPTWITGEVYDHITDDLKYAIDTGSLIWEGAVSNALPHMRVVRSSGWYFYT